MKLTLRKANALENVIQEQLSEKFVGSVVVGKFDNAEEMIGEAQAKLSETIAKKLQLIDVLYSIRKKVAVQNAEVGINNLLTDLARNERETAFHKQLANTNNFTPKAEVLEKALTDLRKDAPATAGYYAQKNNLEVSLLDKETVETYKKTLNLLRKEKVIISDKLLHLNVSSHIELDETEQLVLSKYEIL